MRAKVHGQPGVVKVANIPVITFSSAKTSTPLMHDFGASRPERFLAIGTILIIFARVVHLNGQWLIIKMVGLGIHLPVGSERKRLYEPGIFQFLKISDI